MPVPSEPINIAGSPMREEVRAELEQMLVTGALPPGSRIVDDELVRLTGTSRAPVREALNQLAQVGLVEVQPRRSTVVTPLDGRVSVEALQIEGVVIEQALREAVPALTGEDRDRITAAREGLLRDGQSLAAGVRRREQRPLLDVFVARTGNPEYARLVADVSPIVDRHTALHADGLNPGGHLALRSVLDAALDGDGDLAVERWKDLNARLAASPALTSLPSSPIAAAAEPVTLREKAAREIEKAILDGTLLPGEHVHEADLMRWLGISRTPVREALASLARRGLVTQRVHRATHVALLDDTGLDMVLRALAALRVLTMRLAMARAPQEVLTRVGESLPAWDTARTPEQFADAATVSLEPFAEHCGNALLRAHLTTLVARTRWAASHERLGELTRSAGSVREMHDALADDRFDDAERAMWRMYTGEVSA